MLKRLTLFFALFFTFNCFAQEIIAWDVEEFTDHYVYTAVLDDGVEIIAATDSLAPQKLFVNFVGFDPTAIVELSFIAGTNMKLDGSSVSSSGVYTVSGPHEISFTTASLKYTYMLDGNILYETEALSFGINAISEFNVSNEVDVYPNPTSDGNVRVTLPQTSNPSSSEDLEVIVLGVDSREVDAGINLTNDGSIQLNLRNQPVGLYIVIIMRKDQIFITKIIKD